MQDPTKRFSITVENYQKFRPTYPKEILTELVKNCGLTNQTIIADIGSGTGLLTSLFLENGNEVYAVEPNDAMRLMGEKNLSRYKNFHSIDGRAEDTTLVKDSIDMITVGTAFHWFDITKTKIEFLRILKKPGYVVLIWNVRGKEKSNLMFDYETLIEDYGTDYKNSGAEKFDKTAGAEFFAPYQMHHYSVMNKQVFDWEGFQGRLLSSSYSLQPGHEKFSEMIAALKRIFDRHQENNHIEFIYDTKIYYGRLK